VEKQFLRHFRSDYVRGKFDGYKDVGNMVDMFVESDFGACKVEMRLEMDRVWVRIQLRFRKLVPAISEHKILKGQIIGISTIETVSQMMSL
jgi:hypothetical protein